MRDQDYVSRFNVLKSKKVVRHHLLIKSLFYILEIPKEQVCVKDTQEFFWKIAKDLWNQDLISKMSQYQIVGPKDKDFKAYHTLNYLEKLLSDFQEEELIKYNCSFSLIFRWLKIVIEARKKNICCRLNQAKKAREERDAKIQEENARLEEREAAIQQKREQHEQEHKEEIEKYNEYQASLETETPMQLEEGEEPPVLPQFDEKYAIFEYDEEHPSIPIPDEKVDD